MNDKPDNDLNRISRYFPGGSPAGDSAGSELLSGGSGSERDRDWVNSYDGETFGFKGADIGTVFTFVSVFLAVVTVSLWAGVAVRTVKPVEEVVKKAEAKALDQFMAIDFIDVGQGNSILIRTPGARGKTILIDGGKSAGMYSSFDAGVQVVLPFLRAQGVKRLDQVIMTHTHDDHVGGLVAVLEEEEIGIKEVVEPGMPATTGVYRRFLSQIKRRGIKYTQAKAGMVLDWGDSVMAQIISPKAEYKAAPINNSSVVIRVVHDKVSFLLTGDAEKEAEEDMLSYGKALESDIIQVPHHGGETSSFPDYLALIRPRVAIFMVGLNNKFGHPKAEVVKRYEKVGARVYRTDFNGTITVISNGTRYEVLTEK